MFNYKKGVFNYWWTDSSVHLCLTDGCWTQLLHMSLHNRGVPGTVRPQRGVKVGPNVIRRNVPPLWITQSHLSIPVWQLWVVPVDVFAIGLRISIPYVVESMEVVVWRRKLSQCSFQLCILIWLSGVIHFGLFRCFLAVSLDLWLMLSVQGHFNVSRAVERRILRGESL